MIDLLKAIAETKKLHPSTKIIIISDANDVFIQTFLDNAVSFLNVDKIISNYATYCGDGLTLRPYQVQNECSICPPNLCKGSALTDYMKTHGPFSTVYYIGDGANDICPCLKLTEKDTAFVRKGFGMEKVIARGKLKGNDLSLKAKIVYWDDANVIKDETCVFDKKVADKSSI